MLTNRKNGGGILATNKKKGFAISGILYPLLILTLFLVVQMLFMLQTRKNILDKSRVELADSINGSNKVYTNEELSVLITEQKKVISDQADKINLLETSSNNYNKFKTEQEKFNSDIPIGTYDLFLGDYKTSSVSYVNFGTSYYVRDYAYNSVGWSPSKKAKVCFVGNTTSRGGTYNEYSYTKFSYNGKEEQMEWSTWGNTEDGISTTYCTNISNNYLVSTTVPHWQFWARTNNGKDSIRIYRIYLIMYKD